MMPSSHGRIAGVSPMKTTVVEEMFGLPDQSSVSGDNMDDWFSRMIAPLIRP